MGTVFGGSAELYEELAENLLANSDKPLTDIGQRLFFQDLSAF
ncbi:hypothetical protein GP2143_14136 [marine gamma proteobacterium HTCC2143]|uniref:Uncharacterized protein n=1 Tax=marine gamma proteobacterium HTCC2143 TaxID=247633 RepID=A0Y8E7_9GAMM|nr:hypothetical protein GP2143_14136 [marine gamma proteobacterium HTCC2143]